MIAWGAVVASFALALLAGVLFWMSQGAIPSSDELAQSESADQLIDARRTLELAVQDVIVVRMLDGVGVEGDRSGRLEIAAGNVRTAAGTIRTLAEGDGYVADEAAVFLDDVETRVLDDPVAGSLVELFYIAEDAARYTGANEVITTQRAAVQQLSFVQSLPLHVVIEGIAADTSVNATAVDSAVSLFMDEMVEVVRTEGGWFGIDPATPLHDSIWIEIDEAREMYPAEASRLNELTAASPLVLYDVWMRDLGDGDAPPPFDLAYVLDEADDLATDLSVVIDQLTVEERAERDEVIAGQRSQRFTLLVFAVAVAVLALTLFLGAARSILRSSRSADERARMAMRDALTGAGNRHELDYRTRALTLDMRFGHHVVVMIDLDLFKMVNDVHGHAAGDAILIEIAARLEDVAARMVVGQPDSASTVIRLGGDEFLLTLHGARAFDLDAVRSALDGVRAEFIEYEEKRLDLAFSVGVVHLAGRQELADLMSAADLAVYDEKAVRARVRADAKGPALQSE